MNFIRNRVLSGEFMVGAWSNLGSSITAEMAGVTGFDWLLLDQEHGVGGNETLLRQIQAVAAYPTAPIVRITWNEMPRYKRALDLGAMGVMSPYVQNAEEAAYAAKCVRYSPEGLRGVASSPRCTGYATNFAEYHKLANDNLLTVVQIETGTAIDNIDAIAAVDGVDVLFVGPMDLSISLGIADPFNQADYREVLAKVGRAAKNAGKAAGILLPSADLIGMMVGYGYTFIAVGADGGMVMNGFKATHQALSKFK